MGCSDDIPAGVENFWRISANLQFGVAIGGKIL
jgi:hypothetical protein